MVNLRCLLHFLTCFGILAESLVLEDVIIMTQTQPARHGVIIWIQNELSVEVRELGKPGTYTMFTSELVRADLSVNDTMLFYCGRYKGLCGSVLQLGDCIIIHISEKSRRNHVLRLSEPNNRKGIYLVCESSYLKCVVRVTSEEGKLFVTTKNAHFIQISTIKFMQTKFIWKPLNIFIGKLAIQDEGMTGNTGYSQ